MCLSAIYWAKIKKIYFGCTRQDAEAIGFEDKFIYDILKGAREDNQVELLQIERENCLKPFQEWGKKTDKKRY